MSVPQYIDDSLRPEERLDRAQEYVVKNYLPKLYENSRLREKNLKDLEEICEEVDSKVSLGNLGYACDPKTGALGKILGTYDPGADKLIIDYEVAERGSKELLVYVLAHELEHKMQKEEGKISPYVIAIDPVKKDILERAADRRVKRAAVQLGDVDVAMADTPPLSSYVGNILAPSL